jgi:hypothetical protein
MSSKRPLAALGISAAAFAACAIFMMFAGPYIDSDLITYSFMTVWTASTLAFAYYAVQALKITIKGLGRR